MLRWPEANGCYVHRDESETRTLGFAPGKLNESGGVLSLLYEGGDECPQSPGHNASVLITLMCNERDRVLVCLSRAQAITMPSIIGSSHKD